MKQIQTVQGNQVTRPDPFFTAGTQESAGRRAISEKCDRDKLVIFYTYLKLGAYTPLLTIGSEPYTYGKYILDIKKKMEGKPC